VGGKIGVLVRNTLLNSTPPPLQRSSMARTRSSALHSVVDALHVAASTRVPVPVPGAADPRRGLDTEHVEPRPHRPVHAVEPGEPGPDDDEIPRRPRTVLFAARCPASGTVLHALSLVRRVR